MFAWEIAVTFAIDREQNPREGEPICPLILFSLGALARHSSMNDLLPIIGVAAIAFLATNADNLLLLFAFLTDRSFKPWQVIVGYALSMVAILALSWLVAWFAHFLRPDYVGFLGVVPIGLGLKRLYDRFVRHAGSP